MASRIPRRTFAAPFVVTLAAGCYTQSPPPAQPPPQAPPPTQPDPVVANPPRPQPDPQPTPTQMPPMNPPAPQTSAAQWTVTKQGAICTAAIKVDCPPRLACNPPGPHQVDCYPNMADGASLTVIRNAGAVDCIIPPPPTHCPPKAACNPPPPRHVDCPK